MNALFYGVSPVIAALAVAVAAAFSLLILPAVARPIMAAISDAVALLPLPWQGAEFTLSLAGHRDAEPLRLVLPALAQAVPAALVWRSRSPGDATPLVRPDFPTRLVQFCTRIASGS